jgi:hypothetical protein
LYPVLPVMVLTFHGGRNQWIYQSIFLCLMKQRVTYLGYECL